MIIFQQKKKKKKENHLKQKRHKSKVIDKSWPNSSLLPPLKASL